jgi:RNA polymerase sigma-70 factor (ECF subfamily)
MKQKDTEAEGVRLGVTKHGVARMEALFNKHREGLERFLKFRLWGSPEEAKEIAQEAFTRLLEQLQEREVIHADAWLWRTAQNLLNTRCEQRRIHQAAIPRLQVELEDPPAPEISWIDEEAAAAAIRAAAELPERQRRIFAGCARGETWSQIARDLGIDESTCQRDLKQAILEIRKKIGLEI